MEPASISESAWQRAKADTLRWFHSFRFWTAEIVLSMVVTAVTAYFLPSEWPPLMQNLVSAGVFTGAMFAVIVLVSVGHMVAAPYRQRNEARQHLRQLEGPGVALVQRSPGESLYVPAPEAGLLGGVSLGGRALRLTVSNPSPVRVERVSLLATIWFHFEGGRSESNQAVTVAPLEAPFAIRGHDWSYSWDKSHSQVESHSQVWQLRGLPVTIRPGKEIELPAVFVHINQPDTAVQLFANSQRAILDLNMRVNTDIGVFPLAASIPLVMSRNDGSIVGPKTTP